MRSDIVIKVEGLGKKYAIGKRESYLTLRDRLVELPNKLFKKEKKQEFWALKDVSFEVKRGEVLGVIGRNGAGKSTLLKILARITEPTTGKITMWGRVASMLEVGTGFNPELTGKENIYLNGSIIGMKRKEIEAKFDDITKFAGIGKFLDTPVKHYSSGMYVRLAFAVAAHLDSDILLVDEVLAVGDAEFQKKCLGKMSDMSKVGKTVILVSHNLQSIKNISQKSIYLCDGQLSEIGQTEYVLSKYMQIGKYTNEIIYRVKKIPVQIAKINMLDNEYMGKYLLSKIISFQIHLDVRKKDLLFYTGIEILNESQNVIMFCRDIQIYPTLTNKRHRGIYTYEVAIPPNTLVPGMYQIRVTTSFLEPLSKIEEIDKMLSFDVIDQPDQETLKFPWRSVTSIPLGLKFINKSKSIH